MTLVLGDVIFWGVVSIILRREPEVVHSAIYIQQLVTEHEHPLMLPH